MHGDITIANEVYPRRGYCQLQGFKNKFKRNYPITYLCQWHRWHIWFLGVPNYLFISMASSVYCRSLGTLRSSVISVTVDRGLIKKNKSSRIVNETWTSCFFVISKPRLRRWSSASMTSTVRHHCFRSSTSSWRFNGSSTYRSLDLMTSSFFVVSKPRLRLGSSSSMTSTSLLPFIDMNSSSWRFNG